MTRLFLGLLICGIFGSATPALALIVKKSPKPVARVLVPHRAVYEITLASKKEAVSVAGVRGRMVFEITGSPCNGYTQNMRMITNTTDEQGKKSQSDIRSLTRELGNGRRFLFTSSQYLDRELQETVKGGAARNRNKKAISVKIEKPEAATLDLPGDAIFPIQHSLALIKAAKAGKKQLDVRVFDGSEQGRGFYQTYSFIGEKIPSAQTDPKNKKSEKFRSKTKRLARLGLANLVSWPVAISYFSGQGKSDDTIPAYELAFHLYPNGVSRKLLINYGNISLHGKLERIKYLHPKPCKHKKSNR